ncbi:MAG: TIGR03960 family B12-binding radical SAM protein [Candidatus Omnitrophota bacterium]
MTKPIELNDDILLNVRKPGRYIGKEHNAIVKQWDDKKIKLCLCYPDTYEIGMSNLGLKILYTLVNNREDALCERCFTPWPDMEDVMLKNEIPLFSLENRMPLGLFDIIGFSLQHELTYTNILNMLHLSGIPLESKDRPDRKYPLIIAGGSSAFNPEPLADFIDMFIIGDGEEALSDILETLKKSGADRDKVSLLREMSRIEGVYAPSLYDVSYPDHKLSPRYEGIPKEIKKRSVKELDKKYFPVKPIVPYISTVHDRITLEIMRGCPNKCRFCQAANIYNPLRIRKPDEVIGLAEETYRNTGFDEMSLVSLSSSNYPHIEKLFKGLIDTFAPLGVSISLPSLRIEEKLAKLPLLVGAVKKSGFTFAPEVGTEKMLKVINKNIKHQELFDGLKQAYKSGWRRVKLYFMIGLPLEEESDLGAIIDLADRAATLRKDFFRHPADVVVSVSSFIPKPHTPFQWFRMQDAIELKSKQNFLISKASGKKYLKLKFHDAQASILEGVFSRGDRRMGKVLLKAWQKGAKFDAWSEHFKPALWDEAFLESGIDKRYYLDEIDTDSTLGWEHILCGISKESMLEEYKTVTSRQWQ